MKKSLKKFACLCLALCLFCAAIPVAYAEEEPVLSFLAMSDLHLDDLLFQTKTSNLEQFQKVLEETKDEDLDLFVGGGDYSSYGNSYWWYKTRSMVRQAGFEKSIWAIGNHEYGTTGLRQLVWSKFRIFSEQKSLFYTTEINGCTFIVLGAETGIPGSYGHMSCIQKYWFKKEMQKAAKKADGKPIFVISHFDLDTGDTRSDLVPIMAKYDNVFFLWGHMHDGKYADMTFEQCVHEESGFTAARMGSVHYYNCENADGMIVRVYKDHVTLQMRRVTGKELAEAPYSVPLKQ